MRPNRSSSQVKFSKFMKTVRVAAEVFDESKMIEVTESAKNVLSNLNNIVSDFFTQASTELHQDGKLP